MQRTDHTDDYMLYIPPPSMNLGGIQPEQAHLIDRIIRRFFSMELTKETIAQIIDNMPIKGNYVGLENEWITAHPDIETRSQPSAEAMDRARKICADIDPTSLDFDKRALNGFQVEARQDPQSVGTALRCLEILSSVLHDIASETYSENHPHPDDVEKCNVTPGCTETTHTVNCCPAYGRLHCTQAKDYRIYKHYSSSIVGYWAECMVFGGPVLFYRSSKSECSKAYIDLPPPSHKIFMLPDAQVKTILRLADSGLEQSNSAYDNQPVALPFKPDDCADGTYLSLGEVKKLPIYRYLGQLGKPPRETGVICLKGYRRNS